VFLLPQINLSKLFDYQIIVSIIMVVFAWKLSDWKNWRLYYSTILFYIVVDFLYALLTYNYPLWQLESPILKVTFSDILISFIFVPASILIYLNRFPSGWKKAIAYVLLWVCIYSITEKLSVTLGFISYHHGWTIWCSILFNCLMFPLLYLHYRKPIWAIALTFMFCVIGLIYWRIPLSSIK
jgi:hypothetical protein